MPAVLRFFTRLLRRPGAAHAGAGPAPDAAVDGLRALDVQMQGGLNRAVAMSEGAALQMIERVNSLRQLSARLMDYLHKAQVQSDAMQAEIERSGHIIGDMAGFVQRLPRQIADERVHLDELVAEVRELAGITETIRRMARQTEILSINAAIAAARAGEEGRAFAVLAGEVRRLAMESNASAQDIDQRIRRLVDRVQLHHSGEFADRMRQNEQEADRLLALTGRLDDGFVDMRQFYALLLTAITQHNGALDQQITGLLDTAQVQDVFKQTIERLGDAFADRDEVLTALVAALRAGRRDTAAIDARALALAGQYLARESAHGGPPTAAADAAAVAAAVAASTAAAVTAVATAPATSPATAPATSPAIATAAAPAAAAADALPRIELF